MLKVNNVTKYYGNFLAVDNLSFEVKEGEIFGLLGENGAGKTTTFRMILNLLDASSGEITLNGKNIDYSVTDKIGYLTEERSLLLKLTVKELIHYYGSLKSMSDEDIDRELDYYLDKFDIKEYKNKKIKELSKGNAQKIQFISAIIHKPKLLILDEPFSGLDPINTNLFIEVIKDLKEKGTIIIFSSHQMNNVELFCEKILILSRGKTIISGYLDEIKDKYKERRIQIKADTTITELRQIKNVLGVEKKADYYELYISDEKYVSDIFKDITKLKNVTKFEVVKLSLNEIFIKEVLNNA